MEDASFRQTQIGVLLRCCVELVLTIGMDPNNAHPAYFQQYDPNFTQWGPPARPPIPGMYHRHPYRVPLPHAVQGGAQYTQHGSYGYQDQRFQFTPYGYDQHGPNMGYANARGGRSGFADTRGPYEQRSGGRVYKHARGGGHMRHSPYSHPDNHRRNPDRHQQGARGFANRGPQKYQRNEGKRELPGFSRHRSETAEVDEVFDTQEYSSDEIRAKLKSLQPSYVQCTQHVRYYGRTMDESSSVKALPMLVELYDEFEKGLSTRHAKVWEPNACDATDSNESGAFDDASKTKKAVTAMRKLEAKSVKHVSLHHEEEAHATAIVDDLKYAARVAKKPIEKNIREDNPDVPDLALSELKPKLEKMKQEFDADEGECDNESDAEKSNDEDYFEKVGELISSIRKMKHHKKRLHRELWYNDPGQANDGPLCRCSEAAQLKGIRHNIYPGEKSPPAWHKYRNNVGKIYNYLVTISPPVNFDSNSESNRTKPTTIAYDGRDYVFEGFSLLSDQPLDHLSFCDIIRFHIRYTIYLIEEPPPENFCIAGLQLFSDYFFRDILELYDWVQPSCSAAKDTDDHVHRMFHFFPRFVRPLPDNGKEILSLCEVLKYLLRENKPLVAPEDLDYFMRCSHEEWLSHTDQVRGMIVTLPGSKPSSLRVDQLDRYDRTCVENDQKGEQDDYPLIIHFGIRPANLSYAGDPQYQRVWRSYLKLRHLMTNSPNVKQSDRAKLKKREEALQEMRRAKDMQREVTVEVSSRGFIRTGLFTDICQHALLLPVLTHHIRYQLCLASLEKQIGYKFKERKWLSHAMNHPSCQMNFGSNPDHVRNALSNCGLRQPKYGDSSIHYKYTRKRGITTLIKIMARLGQKRPVLSPIEHNERLEFLGDAVVGYLTSIHLFFMFPDLSEGALTTFRTVIVNNQHLAQLAERMHLDEFMLYAHGPDLCRNSDLRHAMANCFEALMGAIYMEAGLEKAQELFASFLWDSEQLKQIWLDVPLHPLQEEEPNGDRQYIESVPLLQRLTKFEDDIGVKFNHVRILAKAFTWRNVHDNILTHGHNQRLEFLGDSICNLVTSTYLFELYPTHHEGHLTLLRATMVNGRTQSLVATELGMPKYVITSMGNDVRGSVSKPRAPDWREKNLADLLEAFVAALYIDKGLEIVKGFMQVCFFPRLKEFIITQDWNDPKSCLQQCCLTLRQEGKEPQLPTYKIESKAGPSHARKYTVAVYFKGSPIGTGRGESIQEAERNAARKALEEYNFPQLEWQRRYVAKKHNVPYRPRVNLKPVREQEVKS